MQVKFAFLIMGSFDPGRDCASICAGEARMIGVPDIDAACEQAALLKAEGVGCIELCGAFGEQGARRVIEATGGSIPVGYVTHLPEQDALFRAAFGE